MKSNEALFTDTNGDGLIDCQFEISVSENAAGCCESDAILRGKTYSGTAFAALVEAEDAHASAYK